MTFVRVRWTRTLNCLLCTRQFTHRGRMMADGAAAGAGAGLAGYDAAALRHLAERPVADPADDGATRAHRALLAFVKACLVDAAVRSGSTSVAEGGFVLADVACGRGQDFPKLQHAIRNTGKPCLRVQCLDSSAPCLAAAADMAAKYLGPDVAARSAFCCGDAGGDALWPWPQGQAHVLTCHLALHYWCDREARVAAFFRNAAAVTGPHAVMVLSFADGRWVVRAARDAVAGSGVRVGAGAGAGAGDQVEVRMGSCMHVRVPLAHLGPTVPSPWGAPYYFQLGDGARVAATEYLVHEGAVLRVAAAHGWAHVALSARADEAAQDFARRPRFHDFGVAMRALPLSAASFCTAAAYRVVVLAKSLEARGQVLAALAGL